MKYWVKCVIFKPQNKNGTIKLILETVNCMRERQDETIQYLK